MKRLRIIAIVFTILALASIGFRYSVEAQSRPGYYPYLLYGLNSLGKPVPASIDGNGNLLIAAGAGYGFAAGTPAPQGMYPALVYGLNGTTPTPVSMDATGAVLQSGNTLTAGSAGYQRPAGTTVTWINNFGLTGYDLTSGSVSFTTTHLNQVAYFIGGAVASGATVTPPNNFFHVTGTAAIATINAPPGLDATYKAACLNVIADAAFTWTTTGNIATTAGTAVANVPYLWCYDSVTAKWYIK